MVAIVGGREQRFNRQKVLALQPAKKSPFSIQEHAQVLRGERNTAATTCFLSNINNERHRERERVGQRRVQPARRYVSCPMSHTSHKSESYTGDTGQHRTHTHVHAHIYKTTSYIYSVDAQLS